MTRDAAREADPEQAAKLRKELRDSSVAFTMKKRMDAGWVVEELLAENAALRRALPSVVEEIAAERRRQIEAEGWSTQHDDEHSDGELSLAAALYAIPYENPQIGQDDFMGLHMALEIGGGWNLKPEPDKRRRLVKAAALIIAEIERLDRLPTPPAGGAHG